MRISRILESKSMALDPSNQQGDMGISYILRVCPKNIDTTTLTLVTLGIKNSNTGMIIIKLVFSAVGPFTSTGFGDPI